MCVFSASVQMSGVPRAAGAWDDNLEDFLFERLNDDRQVTIAGPRGCEDRPWWWGRSETE